MDFIVILNIAILIIVILIAPYFADFFGNEQLTLIIRVLAVSLLFGAASAVPMALLQRDMKFKLIAIVEFVSMMFRQPYDTRPGDAWMGCLGPGHREPR